MSSPALKRDAGITAGTQWGRRDGSHLVPASLSLLRLYSFSGRACVSPASDCKKADGISKNGSRPRLILNLALCIGGNRSLILEVFPTLLISSTVLLNPAIKSRLQALAPASSPHSGGQHSCPDILE